MRLSSVFRRTGEPPRGAGRSAGSEVWPSAVPRRWRLGQEEWRALIPVADAEKSSSSEIKIALIKAGRSVALADWARPQPARDATHSHQWRKDASGKQALIAPSSLLREEREQWLVNRTIAEARAILRGRSRTRGTGDMLDERAQLRQTRRRRRRGNSFLKDVLSW